MTSTTRDFGFDGTGEAPAWPHLRIAPALFAATVFLSAALVFLVEPMIAKLVLPTLGGSPAVWNTSLAFFQIALLVGYGYAHALQRLACVQGQVVAHGAVLVAAATVLPLAVSPALGDPDPAHPTLWLLGVLALSVGLPFAALSATAPLVQAWYARPRAGRLRAEDPYRLYAASNLGSLAALAAYPLVVEPLLALKTQTLAWSLGYGGFMVLVAGLGSLMWRDAGTAIVTGSAEATASPVAWRDRLVWVALAAAPSSLMLGVTSHIASDIASAPLLWVVPLALYLLTFVIAFGARPLIGRDTALVLQAAAFLACLTTIGLPIGSALPQAGLALAGFFLTALVCHQGLAARRPAPARLTEFYLLMSLGGVIGGAFNAFLAPVLFSTVLEYPLVLVLSVLARPWAGARPSPREMLWLLAGLAASLAALAIGRAFGLGPVAKAMLATAVVAAFLLRDRTLPFLALCAAILAVGLGLAPAQDILATQRSFFGVVRVLADAVPGHGGTRVMVHGTTRHGAQLQNPAERCRPLLYYAPTTPIGQVFRAVQARRGSVDVGAIGMGAGSVAAYTRPGDSLRFFEIDPLVARVAEDPAQFSFINGCAGGRIDAVLGDARLTLAREPDDRFDILLVDAFSSDSVPAHLLTVEAMRGYLRHVRPDGLVIMHLSNNNLELLRPVAAIAAAAGGVALRQTYRPPDGALPTIDTGEDAIVVARTASALAPIADDPRWRPAEAGGVAAWTDDYTNLAGALWRGIGHIERETRE